MIILVVFSPIFTFEGVEAKLFQPMAISIMLAILAAVLGLHSAALAEELNIYPDELAAVCEMNDEILATAALLQ